MRRRSKVAGIAAGAQAARRALVAQGLHVSSFGIQRDWGPVVVVANHASRVDRRVVSSVWPNPLLDLRPDLARGASVLAFPEGGISPDGSVGRFRPDAFRAVQRRWAAGASVAVVPVAIWGTFGLDRQLPWWKAPSEQPRIEVRAGNPVFSFNGGPDELADHVRSIVVDLLREGETTWWQLRRGDETADVGGGGARWHEAWRNGERRPAPGVAKPHQIWR